LNEVDKLDKKPLSYDEWKQSRIINLDDSYIKSFERLHGVDPAKELEEMLRKEYEEYKMDFDGRWLNL
jgi:hypothetical protein